MSPQQKEWWRVFFKIDTLPEAVRTICYIAVTICILTFRYHDGIKNTVEVPGNAKKAAYFSEKAYAKEVFNGSLLAEILHDARFKNDTASAPKQEYITEK